MIFVEGRKYKCTSVVGARPCFEDCETGDELYNDKFIMVENDKEYRYTEGIYVPVIGLPITCVRVEEDDTYLDCKVCNMLLKDVVPESFRKIIKEGLGNLGLSNINFNTEKTFFENVVPWHERSSGKNVSQLTSNDFCKWLCEYIEQNSGVYSGSWNGAVPYEKAIISIYTDLLGTELGVAYSRLTLLGKCSVVTVSSDGASLDWRVDGTDVVSFVRGYIGDIGNPNVKIVSVDVRGEDKRATQSNVLDRIAGIMGGS